MSGKAIAIGVLAMAAVGIVWFIDNGTKTSVAEKSSADDVSTDTRKPGYVSGAEIDPYNILSTDPADIIPNPAYEAWSKVNNELVKASRFDNTITLPPAPPKYIYR